MATSCLRFSEEEVFPLKTLLFYFYISPGLVLECPSTTAFSLRTTLQVIKAPIQSLSIYDFDNSVTTLTPEIFGQTKLPIRHLQFSQSSLQRVADESLRGISSSLESLSIVSGKLQKVSPFIILQPHLILIPFPSSGPPESYPRNEPPLDHRPGGE